MFWYVLKLLLLLPLIGVMIWGSLKLTQRMQGRFGAPQGGSRAVRIRCPSGAPPPAAWVTARGARRAPAGG